jgi:small subunit ribosomal protein S6
MYILASSVSDDQVPATSDGVQQIVADFGGENIQHQLLGKKKLAYPIKKTRNGHYGVIAFDLEGKQLNPLDAKIRTQTSTIIRHLIVNLDEHLDRLEKDRVVQSKMNRTRPPEAIEADMQDEAPQPKPAKEAKPVTPAELDEEIEKALSEDLTK